MAFSLASHRKMAAIINASGAIVCLYFTNLIQLHQCNININILYIAICIYTIAL